MTIWGVEYDSEGVISAIYYADNNDDYLSAQPVAYANAYVIWKYRYRVPSPLPAYNLKAV